MRPLWFKTKTYGWGWTPSTWQGWLVIVLYFVINGGAFFFFDASSHSASDTLRPFFIVVAVSTAALLALCYRYGETPRWRWGPDT